MTWIYQNEDFNEIPDNVIGFVYLITNLKTGQRYVGKKLFRFTRTKKVKGKKQRKQAASDWMTYYGSNKVLQEEVTVLGEEHFKREILHLCRTKGECSYMETKEIFLRDAVLSDDYYNQWVSCKIARNHLPKELI